MKNAGRVEFANALRGIAALSVMFAHYFGVFWTAPAAVMELTGLSYLPAPIPVFVRWTLIPHFNWGAFGVALFFLISGFVIPFAFKTYDRIGFLVGRFFRLFPTYWLGLTISLIIVVIACHFWGSSFPHSLKELMTGYALGFRDVAWIKSVDGIVWTLEVELRFYLICALIAPWLRDGSAKSFLVPIILFALIILLSRWLSTATETTWFFLAHNAPYLLFMFIGVALNFRFRGKISASLSIFVTTCLIIMFWYGLNFGLFKTPSIVPSYIVAVALFVTAYGASKFIAKIPTINFWAKISYPLYVIHAVVGYVLMTTTINLGVTSLIAVATAFSTTTLIAFLLHKYIEHPTHKIGQQIASNIRLRSDSSNLRNNQPVANDASH